jgi:TolA-binding protein
VLGVTLVGGGAAVPIGYYAWQRHEAAARSAAAAASARAAKPAATVSPDVAPEAPPSDATVRSAGPASQVTLTRELVALDAARSTLARGDAQGALAMLDQYARKNPNGRLAIEAEVLRIDALASSGRKELATRRAEAFLKRYPNSVLAPRVRVHVR